MFLPQRILELEKLLSLDFLPDQQRGRLQDDYMQYLLNGGPGILNYQTMKVDQPEAETEVPLAIVLSDVEECNPMDTSIQSITSHITWEKYNTDADTEDDDNAREEGYEEDNGDEDENGENIDEEENGENRDEEENGENRDEVDEEGEGESGKRWEDDGEEEEEQKIIEKEKSYGTIRTNPSKLRNAVFTPTEPSQDSSETSYEMFVRRQSQVPITRPFVSSRNTSFTSSSAQSVDSGRVTRGSATKRSEAEVTAEEEEDTADYFSAPKKGRKGKK